MADTPLQITGREDKTEPQITVAGVVVNALKGAVADVQDYAMLCGRTLVALVTPPYYLQDILQQMDSIGAGSLPIILLSGFFIGAVMVLQTGAQFTRFGQTSLTGDVVAIALVRELGPSLYGIAGDRPLRNGHRFRAWLDAGDRTSGRDARDGHESHPQAGCAEGDCHAPDAAAC